MICRASNNKLIIFDFDFLKESKGQHRELPGGESSQSVTDTSLPKCSKMPSCHLLYGGPDKEKDGFCPCCECNPCDCH